MTLNVSVSNFGGVKLFVSTLNVSKLHHPRHNQHWWDCVKSPECRFTRVGEVRKKGWKNIKVVNFAEKINQQ